MNPLRWLTAGSLPFRLAGLMTVALLPLGLIALYQANAVLQETDRLSHTAVLARTEKAAAKERELLEWAGGATAGLAAAILPVAEDPVSCSNIMRTFTTIQDKVSFAAFIRPDGKIECASDGTVADVSGNWAFLKALDEPGLSFSVDRGGPDGRARLLATSPVRPIGVLAGYVTIAIPHSLSDTIYGRLWATGGIQFATVDSKGEILSASMPLEEAALSLPVSVPRRDLLSHAGETFFEDARSGDKRFFAVSEILPSQVAVVGSWPAEEAQTAAGSPGLVMTLVFPVMMWLAGISVAMLGLERLVVRHLRALRAAMRRYALGERNSAALQLSNPPQEFEEAQRSFNRMVAILSKAEQQREQDLHEKSVLLRELHHRVKNNLQLIASIMNMMGRSAQTAEARGMLAQLQRRIRGLAAIHRSLNTDPGGITAVDSRALISELIDEIGAMNAAGGKPVRIRTDLLQVALDQDQAVTLAMLVSEAMTNAVKYVGESEDGLAEISVALRKAGGNRLELTVTNTKSRPARGPEEPGPGSGIGSRLMLAFADQLGGEGSAAETEETFSYRLVFPVAAADAAPSRAAPSKTRQQVGPAGAG